MKAITITPIAPKGMKSIMDKGVVEDRARVLLEAWLRGQNRGGFTPSPQDIGEVYITCLNNALWEMTQCPLRK